MKETSKNLSVGAFALGGLVALCALVIRFGMSPHLNTYPLEFHFDQTGGIREQDQVLLNGYEVGTVGSVEFIDPQDPGKGVKVIANIRHKYRIPRGVTARIEMPAAFGLAARSCVTLLLPAGPATGYLDKNGRAQPIRGTVHSGEIVPRELIDKASAAGDAITTLADKLSPVLDNLGELLAPRSIGAASQPAGAPAAGRAGPNLSSTVQRLDRLLENFNALIGDPKMREDFKRSVENVRLATEDSREMIRKFKQFADQAEVVADKTDKVVDQLSDTAVEARHSIVTIRKKAVALADRLDGLLASLGQTIGQFGGGHGTMTKLLRDPRLYDELVETVERINKAVTELRKLLKHWRERGVRTRLFGAG